MKRASYREAVRWIASNDSPGDYMADDPKTISELTTSVLIADIFDIEPIKVGNDVSKERKKIFPKNIKGK